MLEKTCNDFLPLPLPPFPITLFLQRRAKAFRAQKRFALRVLIPARGSCDMYLQKGQ